MKIMDNNRTRTFPLNGNFTFVDVEIPNINTDRVCAISMIVVENHHEVFRHTELINPQTFFSAPNIRVHGIRKKDVANARTFDQFWKDYSRYFSEGYIIGAHNANSDIAVINRDLQRFHTRIEAEFYIDTMDLMKDIYYEGKPEKGDLKLDHAALRLGVTLDHHNPESDVNACYEIVKRLSENIGFDQNEYIRKIPPRKEPRSKTHIRKAQSKPDGRLSKLSVRSSAREDLIQKGKEAYSQNQYEEAASCFSKAVKRSPGNVYSILSLADCLIAMDQPKEARKVLFNGIRECRGRQNSMSMLYRKLKHLPKKGDEVPENPEKSRS